MFIINIIINQIHNIWLVIIIFINNNANSREINSFESIHSFEI